MKNLRFGVDGNEAFFIRFWDLEKFSALREFQFIAPTFCYERKVHMNALVFGAGNIGRGFLGSLLVKADFLLRAL